MTDNDSLWWESQFSYSEWIDTKTNPDSLILSRKTTAPVTNTDNFLMFAEYDNFFYFGEWWRVYNKSWTLVYTLPWNRPIRNVAKFWDNFLMFYSTWNSIRIARTWFIWSSPDFWSVTVQWWTLDPIVPNSFSQPYDTVAWPFCCLINDSEDTLYFVVNNKVYRIIVTTAPFIEVWLVLEWPIVWLTKNGSQINVYLMSWRKYFWDGFSLQHDGYVDLWEDIRFVQDTKNYDYIVAGTASSIYSKMFVSQWQEFSLVKKASFTLEKTWNAITKELWKNAYWITWRFWNFCITTDQDNVYNTIWDYWRIEAFWNKVVWTPMASSVEYSNDEIQDFWWIWSWKGINWWFVFFSYRDTDWNCFVDSIANFRTPSPKFVWTWTLYTQKFSFWTQKVRIKQYRIRAFVPNGTWISIYASYNWNQNYELIKSLETWDKTDIYSLTSWWPFFEIQRKIEMTSNNENVTPILYQIDVDYVATER